MTRANRSWDFAGYRKTREGIFEPCDLTIEHRDIEMLSCARRIARAQSAQNRYHAIKGGGEITDRYAASSWLAAGLAGDAHRAAERLCDDIVGGRRSHRSGLPEAGNRAQNNP